MSVELTPYLVTPITTTEAVVRLTDKEDWTKNLGLERQEVGKFGLKWILEKGVVWRKVGKGGSESGSGEKELERDVVKKWNCLEKKV